MRKKILLVEPDYKSKFPPLGLMKISQYHKEKGDHVEFVKGMSIEKRDKNEWDRIYVSTLFTYDWSVTLKTIKYYRYSVKEPESDNLVVGGVMSTLMADDIRDAVNCKVIKGLLDKKGSLGYEDDDKIDLILPDYSILNEIEYKYPVSNAYFAYMTRGCIRTCSFCAVPIIEPEYKPYISLTKQIQEIDNRYGPKKDLLLMDNNVLASSRFRDIINEIKSLGFISGAKYSYRSSKNNQIIKANRHVDFNQGVDARLLTEEKMYLLSEIAIKPLRIAFDDIKFRSLYEEKVRLAAKYGLKDLSNYILYNYQDKPEDLYSRLRINIELNEELRSKIYSFPMRYIDIRSKNRLATTKENVGLYWNRKFLRSIQCVLNATRGIVGPNLSFFEAAFGKDINEYWKILLMPEDYIIHREIHKTNGNTDLWWQQFNLLSSSEKGILLKIVYENSFKGLSCIGIPKIVKLVLQHYVGSGAFEFNEESSD